MTEETPRPEKTIADELSRLGKQLSDAAKAAWESEDRKRLQAEIESVFVRMGFRVFDLPEVETEHYCFEALNMPRNHPARDGKGVDVRPGARLGAEEGVGLVPQDRHGGRQVLRSREDLGGLVAQELRVEHLLAVGPLVDRA